MSKKIRIFWKSHDLTVVLIGLQTDVGEIDCSGASFMELAPVEFENLTEHLVRRMKTWVVRGLIKPGERLPPEREMATMLEYRASLRGALKVLQVMGVLDLRQGSGNYLTRDAASILNQPTDLLIPLRGLSFGALFEARRAMECEAAACAAVRGSPADVDRLRREIEHMRQSLLNPVVYFRHDVLSIEPLL